MLNRLSLKEMADWCRSLGSSLHAGLSIVDALELTARRGSPRIRTISKQVVQDIRNGADLEESLRNRGDIYPPLFLAMAQVASHTGHLPEVLRRLEDFFRFQIKLRRQFIQQIFWPGIQLIGAIGVIALLIFILGIISDINRSAPITIVGLSGTSGALIWLFGWAAFFGAFIAAYWVSKNVLRSGFVDKLLLRVPVLGKCMEALALSRFCFALSVTMDTGMSIFKALPLSLKATDNGAYASLEQSIVEQVAEGTTLTETFSQYAEFPDEFLAVLQTAENSGTVPESMGKLSQQYHEMAEHRMALLNVAVGWCVWLLVAALIIYMIFQIFITAYYKPMQEALDMING